MPKFLLKFGEFTLAVIFSILLLGTWGLIIFVGLKLLDSLTGIL
jgi:hypothetical protein